MYRISYVQSSEWISITFSISDLTLEVPGLINFVPHLLNTISTLKDTNIRFYLLPFPLLLLLHGLGHA